MIKLNDTSVEVGQIKQILSDFNLPLCRVGETFPAQGNHFITLNDIKVWDIDKNSKQLIAKKCSNYNFGDAYQNLTSNLISKNLIYDRETHRYLGSYLRFIRDYCGLDLMSMYNCFDSDLSDIDVEFDTDSGNRISFNNVSSSSYYIYKIPVSILNTLTISLHSFSNIELCLTVDYTESDKILAMKLAKETYFSGKVNSIFTLNVSDNLSANYPELISFISKYYRKTYLLLKVSKSLKTSIVVLEGTYTDRVELNSSYLAYKPIFMEGYLIENNYNYLIESLYKYLKIPLSVSLEDAKQYLNINDSGFNISSQLLSHENYSSNYLLGDKLIEYLTNNAITMMSNSYDIKHIQKFIDHFRYTAKSNLSKSPSDRYYGIWNKYDSIDLKQLIYNMQLNQNYDMIGYFDKDFEAKFIEKFDNIVALTEEGDFN